MFAIRCMEGARVQEEGKVARRKGWELTGRGNVSANEMEGHGNRRWGIGGKEN